MKGNTTSKIKTTGELREFLVNMMLGVKDGQLTTEKASGITKMAGEINESIYSELKAIRVGIELGKKAAEISEMGTMQLGVHEVA